MNKGDLIEKKKQSNSEEPVAQRSVAIDGSQTLASRWVDKPRADWNHKRLIVKRRKDAMRKPPGSRLSKTTNKMNQR